MICVQLISSSANSSRVTKASLDLSIIKPFGTVKKRCPLNRTACHLISRAGDDAPDPDDDDPT